MRIRGAYGRDYPLGPVTLIGREAECQLVLDEPHISRYHAKITVTHNQVVIEDLHSRNGTYVNGARITAPRELGIGDEIRFDTEIFRLATSDSGQAESTIMRSPAQMQGAVELPLAPVPPLVVEPRAAPETGSAAPGGEVSPAVLKPSVPAPAVTPGGEVAFSAVEPSLDDTDATRRLRDPLRVSHPALSAVGDGHRLLVLSPPARGKLYGLEAPGKTEWFLGRDSDNDILLVDGTVSGRHARVYRQGRRWAVANQGSTNGVLLNGVAVEQGWLEEGDIIRLGRIELQFFKPGSAPGAVAPRSKSVPPSMYPWRWWIAGTVLLALVVVLMMVALFMR